MANGAQFGITGDDYGTNLPVTEVDKTELAVETNMARFSKSAEFKKLKEHLEGRISHYQQYLPDGRDVSTATKDELAYMWVTANAIIGEFTAVLAAYEQAKTAVEDKTKRNLGDSQEA